MTFLVCENKRDKGKEFSHWRVLKKLLNNFQGTHLQRVPFCLTTIASWNHLIPYRTQQ